MIHSLPNTIFFLLHQLQMIYINGIVCSRRGCGGCKFLHPRSHHCSLLKIVVGGHCLIITKHNIYKSKYQIYNFLNQLSINAYRFFYKNLLLKLQKIDRAFIYSIYFSNVSLLSKKRQLSPSPLFFFIHLLVLPEQLIVVLHYWYMLLM